MARFRDVFEPNMNLAETIFTTCLAYNGIYGSACQPAKIRERKSDSVVVSNGIVKRGIFVAFFKYPALRQPLNQRAKPVHFIF